MVYRTILHLHLLMATDLQNITLNGVFQLLWWWEWYPKMVYSMYASNIFVTWYPLSAMENEKHPFLKKNVDNDACLKNTPFWCFCWTQVHSKPFGTF